MTYEMEKKNRTDIKIVKTRKAVSPLMSLVRTRF